MATEIKANGKGGFTAKDGASKDVKKASAEFPPGFKEMTTPMLTKASERLSALVDMVNGAKTADVPEDGSLPGVPADFTNELASVYGLLEKIGTMWPASSEAPEPNDTGDTEPDPNDPNEPAEMQLRFAEKAVSAYASMLKRAGVEKIGAKMSKDRLTRLHQALQVISNLVSELEPAAAAPSGEVDTGKSTTQKSEVPAWAIALSDSVSGLTNVVRKMQGEVESIKKGRRVGTDEVEVETPKKDGKFVWPKNMNDPVTRDRTEKRHSYFDEDL